MTTSRSDLGAYLAERRTVVDAGLHRFFPRPDGWPTALYDASAWALFGGGKRMRPVLAMAAFEAVRGTEARPIEAILPAACAVEMVHTYSLVHDDLPCMDDDDERRGRPTVHIKFGEALALLAGDALLTEALRLASDRQAYQGAASAEQVADVTAELARAAGWLGMVGGQSIDLGFEQPVRDEAALTFLHRHKTGMLFRFSTWAGALLGGGTAAQIEALSAYGETLGMAFQISDDLLDDEQDQTERGADTSETPSFPALIGSEASRQRAASLLTRCETLLDPFDARADPLRHLAWFAVHRDH